MEHQHHFSKRLTREQRAELAELGVIPTVLPDLPGALSPPIAVWDVRESHPNWSRIEELVAAWKPLDIESTEFSDSECAAADALDLESSWLFSYPQPESGFGYLRLTYNLEAYCDSCGTGQIQIAPFRLIRAPRWQRKRIFALNWVYDAFFVEPGTYANVFEPLGVGFWPVHDRRGHPLDDVVQLRIDDVVELDRTGLEATECPMCGRPKYAAVVRGSYPQLVRPSRRPLVRSDAWFGSGASGWQLIVGSPEVYRNAKAANLRGMNFGPLGHVTLRDAD